MLSLQKVTNADLIIAIDQSSSSSIVERKIDPHSSHPLIMTDICGSKKCSGKNISYDGKVLNNYLFLAIVYAYKIKKIISIVGLIRGQELEDIQKTLSISIF